LGTQDDLAGRAASAGGFRDHHSIPFFADARILRERGLGKLGGGIGPLGLKLLQLCLIRRGTLPGLALLAFD
jgi:hypothetical protein